MRYVFGDCKRRLIPRKARQIARALQGEQHFRTEPESALFTSASDVTGGKGGHWPAEVPGRKVSVETQWEEETGNVPSWRSYGAP
jgi:hypothetical protein